MSSNFRRSSHLSSILKIFLLVLYLAFLSWRMFFYAYSNFYRIPGRAYEYNVVPLKTIYSLITSYSRYGFTVWAYNLFGNIAVFMPLGFLLASLQKKKNSLSAVLTYSFFIILFAESMQLIMRVGVFDIDDIILNLIGCLVGYYAHRILVKHSHVMKK